MSYQKRTERHLSIIDDNTQDFYKRSHAKQCLGALYTAYTRDHRRMKNLFIKAHGLTQDVADAVIAFGERDSQKI